MTEELKGAYLDMEAAGLAAGAAERRMRELGEVHEAARFAAFNAGNDWALLRTRFERATARYYRLLNGIPEPAGSE